VSPPIITPLAACESENITLYTFVIGFSGRSRKSVVENEHFALCVLRDTPHVVTIRPRHFLFETSLVKQYVFLRARVLYAPTVFALKSREQRSSSTIIKLAATPPKNVPNRTVERSRAPR